ncbi:MAG: hypothetical protein HY898_18280 [Deltaproteobacteria bacterium]|nr:hypothetical protein [Deltaproteobacteria bacterium]
MTQRRAWWLGAFAIAPLAWLACNALAGIDEPVVVEEGGPGACVPNRPPEPPKTNDTGDAGAAFALHRVSFGDLSGIDPVPASPGYDLDDACTCLGDPSCAPLVASFPACDFDGGTDNAFLGLWAKYSAMIGMAEVNQSINAGEFGFIVKIDGYNGLQDDPVVDMTFLVASRANPLADGGGPGWTGSDQWNINDISFLDGGVPRARDNAAYVAGGVLVARLANAGLLFLMNGRPLRVDVTQAVLTARISVGVGGIPILDEGQFAGRIPQESLIAAISTLPLLEEPIVCASPTAFESVRAEVCKRADILRKSGGAKAARCDALSFVLAFDAVQAKVGVVETVKQFDAGPCPAGTKFDCVDVDD